MLFDYVLNFGSGEEAAFFWGSFIEEAYVFDVFFFRNNYPKILRTSTYMKSKMLYDW